MNQSLLHYGDDSILQTCSLQLASTGRKSTSSLQGVTNGHICQ